jgi:hypothetical protein
MLVLRALRHRLSASEVDRATLQRGYCDFVLRDFGLFLYPRNDAVDFQLAV